MLLPRQYLSAVVALGTEDVHGEKHWIASGVNYARVLDAEAGTYVHYLVTNKHVIQGLETAYVRLNPLAQGPAVEVKVALHPEGEDQYWYAHPDPEVDIAVTPVDTDAVREAGLSAYFFRSDAEAMTLDQMRAAEVSEGDPVFVLGFPMGLVGEERSVVIARGGWLARIQDTLAQANRTFLVDASVFPGNSGGAVVLRPELASLSRTKGVSSALLIGVVAAYVPYRDTAVSIQTQQPRVIFEENSGLVEVYPLDFVEEIIATVPLEEDDQPATAPVASVPPEEVSGRLESDSTD